MVYNVLHLYKVNFNQTIHRLYYSSVIRNAIMSTRRV